VTPSPQPPLVPGARTPAPLTVAAGLVGVEAVLLVVYGVVESAVIRSEAAAMGITTTLFFLVYGAGLGYCAWQLSRLHSWARAPVVLAQLIQLGVAWSFRGGSGTVVAVVLAVLAVVVLAGVFHPASLAALAEHVDDEPDDAG
jgi:hypothetical protein